jgi:hypothetical protein
MVVGYGRVVLETRAIPGNYEGSTVASNLQATRAADVCTLNIVSVIPNDQVLIVAGVIDHIRIRPATDNVGCHRIPISGYTSAIEGAFIIIHHQVAVSPLVVCHDRVELIVAGNSGDGKRSPNRRGFRRLGKPCPREKPENYQQPCTKRQ